MDDRAGAGTVFAVLIAGVVFLGTVGYIVYESGTVGSQQREGIDARRLQREAVSLSTILLTSPGITLDGTDWIQEDDPTAPDRLHRLGLHHATPGDLNFSKFENLRLAPYTADGADGYVNYEEAVRSLGLDDAGLDFHIRASPTMKKIRDILDSGHKDPNMRVTYVGDWEKATGGGGPAPDEDLLVLGLQCHTSPASGSSYRFNVTLFNGGTGPTQFHIYWEIDFNGDGTDEVSEAGLGWLVSPLTSQNMVLDVPAKSGRSCSSATRVDLEVWDPSSSLRTENDRSLGSFSGSPATASKDVWADVSKTSFRSGEDIRIDYDGDVVKDDVLKITVWPDETRTGAYEYYTEETVPQAAGQRYVTIPGGTLADGSYTVDVLHVGSGVVATERILVTATAPVDYAPPGGSTAEEAQEPVAYEVEFLDRLVERFCPYEYDSMVESPMTGAQPWATRCGEFKAGQTQPGDVMPDLKKTMDDELPKRLLNETTGLPRYDVTSTLVIGSQVSQNAMTSASAKEAVRDWVRGGGTLIVFGSASQNVQWLQPLFHSGIHSSSGGITTPDESHPLLRTPDPLDFDKYENNDLVWKLNSEHDDYFTNIVEQDGSPVTALSDPGAFNKGTIILTTWLPYDIFGTGPGTTDEESLKLVNNMLTMSYRTLYLDYGPKIPDEVSVTPAVSKATIVHPDLGRVILDVTVYVFPS